MFADLGDRVTVRLADKASLEVIGPLAEGVPTGEENLVMRVAALFDQPAAIILSKHLPAAAGIGGGSSDAAATALALADLTGLREMPPGLTGLGADIRVCLMRQAARMQGIGEIVTPVSGLPLLWAVLANPRVEVPTPGVFKALETKNAPPMPRNLPKKLDSGSFIQWLAKQRNDLEKPAISLQPVIGKVLSALRALEGAQLVRMSGSGATCFALFLQKEEAEQAARTLATDQPNWWVHTVQLS